MSENTVASAAVLFDELMLLIPSDLMHWALVGSLAILCASFVLLLLVPALALHVKLSRAIAAIDIRVSDTTGADREPTIRDPRLHELFQQYLRTLHTPQGGIDPGSGIAKRSAACATLPAESYFNNQTVFESRLHTEFFKHLPGLLTGIGIIGTFFGLIFGLGKAQSAPGGLNENMHVLVASVKEAFVISAWAICAAMVVTFLEKWLVAGLSAKVNRLCRSLNRLHPLSSGEEYLEKLVSASEFSASNAGALKDALVEQLGAILERLAARQIDVAAQQQERLRQELVAAIDSGLRAPLGSIAQGLGQFRSDQGEQITRSLQDSMTAFADKLDQMLGGQIGQAKDLQVQTLQALEQAVVAFKAMAQQVGSAGETATSAMAARLTAALEEMASRQTQMADGIQNLLIAMRTEATRSQSQTAHATAALIEQLGTQVRTISQHLIAQSDATQAKQQVQLAEFSTRTAQLSQELIAGVREQTAAIDKATAAMQGAVADLNLAVSRNVEQVGLGATRIGQAAERFSGAGEAVSDVLDRSKGISAELSSAATTLARSSNDVHAVLSDYRDARERFATLVSGLEQTIETATRDAATTSDLVAQLRKAAEVMNEAQRSAEQYMGRVSDVLATAHDSFSKQMVNTVNTVTGAAHGNLDRATKMIAETIHDLENTLDGLRPGRN